MSYAGDITPEQSWALLSENPDAVLVDWELTDLTRNRIPYTSATRAEVVEEWDGIEGALVTAYFDAGRKARQATEIAKNSEAPSATA